MGHHDHVFQFQPPPPITKPQLTSQDTSFPILLVAIIGILTTAFLLVSYYVFVIKCCLNRHRIDFLRPSRRSDQLIFYASRPPENSGLDESVIRAIPIVQFKRIKRSSDFCECAVCLNEFQEEEKLRLLPSCSHAFHIDCIDIWLQSNANCPLCRSSVSSTLPFPIVHSFSDTVMGGDESFVVIEVRNGGETVDSEIPTNIPISPRKLDQRVVEKKSKGDECIDVRRKDDQFAVQPIRRSFSMDSSADRQLYLSVQEALLKQNGNLNELTTSECCCSSSSRMRRSLFFSFGSGRGSRSAVLPVEFEPNN